MSKLVPLSKLGSEFPDWPCSYWATMALIKKGDLKTVKLGGRYFVTRELIDECIALRTGQHYENRRARKASDSTEATRG